jgi:hypothetical protein
MTIRRAPILKSLISRLAIAAIWTTLGSAPGALAAGVNFDDAQLAITDHWLTWHSLMVFSFDNDSGKPLSPSDDLAFAIIQGLAPKTEAASSITKSLANYGGISPIPGTKGSDDCRFSLGNALHPSGKFVYLSGGIGSPGRLCGFAIDTVTQAWTPITPPGAKPAAVGTNPRAVVIEPSGRFVYVAGDFAGTVSGFRIDRATGVPTPLPGSPFPTLGSLPIPMVIDRSGRFLYVGQSVGSFDGSIAVFAIDAATGALSHIAGSPFPNVPNFGRVAALALSPDGRFLFTGGTALATYAVNPVTGVPTRIASRDGLCCGLMVDSTGQFLFGTAGDGLHGFSIAADGALTPVGVPQSIGSGTSTITALVSVADLVYVGNAATGGVYGFRVNPATGALTPVAGSPFASPPLLRSFAASANLPPAIQVDVGDNVVASVGVYGGRPPYTWSITSGALPPGSALNATTGTFSGILTAAGTYSFAVQVADSLGVTASAAKSITVGGGGSPPPVTVVEFYNASLDHYFITYVTEEIAKLDNGTFKGWTRTGLSFNAYATTQSGTSAVCRIYIPPGKGDGHFFGRDANECNGTMTKNPTFILESSAFLYLYPPTLGNCAAGQVPVYRVFSNRADANHRYTTSRAVRDQMVGKGWLAEGDGADIVVMCGPS